MNYYRRSVRSLAVSIDAGRCARSSDGSRFRTSGRMARWSIVSVPFVRPETVRYWLNPASLRRPSFKWHRDPQPLIVRGASSYEARVAIGEVHGWIEKAFELGAD
jgi:hypothetical protein